MIYHIIEIWSGILLAMYTFILVDTIKDKKLHSKFISPGKTKR